MSRTGNGGEKFDHELRLGYAEMDKVKNSAHGLIPDT